MLATLCWTSSSHADWINLTGAETAENIAEIYVGDDQVLVAFEVFPRDKDILLPDSRFALVVEADGTALQAEVMKRDRRQRKDRGS